MKPCLTEAGRDYTTQGWGSKGLFKREKGIGRGECNFLQCCFSHFTPLSTCSVSFSLGTQLSELINRFGIQFWGTP